MLAEYHRFTVVSRGGRESSRQRALRLCRRKNLGGGGGGGSPGPWAGQAGINIPRSILKPHLEWCLVYSSMYASSMPEESGGLSSGRREWDGRDPCDSKRIRLKQEEVKLTRRAWMDVGTLGEFSGAAQTRSLHAYTRYGAPDSRALNFYRLSSTGLWAAHDHFIQAVPA